MSFRYAMTPRWRAVRVATFVAASAVLLVLALGAVDVVGVLLALVVLVWCARSLRIVVGPAVVVRDDALVVIPAWPRRRRVPWDAVTDVEVVGDRWVLRLELAGGTELELPAVERLDELYELVQHHRGVAG